MSETCWFCKKQPGDSTNSINIPIIKVLDSHETRSQAGIGPFVTNNINVTNTIRYLEEKILVPRCRTCAQSHSNVRWIKILGIVIPILLVIFSFLAFVLSPADSPIQDVTGVLCGGSLFAAPVLFLFGLLGGTEYLRRKGVLPEKEKKNHPDLVERQKIGWVPTKKL